MPEQAEHSIKMSVRGIVEFILRSGSITTGYMSANRAVEGTIFHQKIQRRRKSEAQSAGLTYKSEVSLKLTVTYNNYEYEVEGRADGVVTGGPSVIIEEIKSTLKPVDQIENDPNHWHWAQAKCYGYIYCRLYDVKNVMIRLTYGHLETEESVSFSLEMNFSELESFFLSIMERYHRFAEMEVKRVEERNETAGRLSFPFGAFRKGQRELCVSVYASIKQGRRLFAQAPTGTGKTVSALFPSIKALGGFADKIFYCTAKTITRRVAEDNMRLMIQSGLRVRSVTLTAKDKICFLPQRLCNPIDCEFANGHFDRVNDALLDIITNETLIDRTLLETYARKHKVCPFEFMLDATLFCDVIVCDYNHVYDPKAKLKRYFADGGKFILLNDEAHNLVERGRDMFSASITRGELKETRELFDKKSDIYKGIGKVLKYFKECGRETPNGAYTEKGLPVTLCNLLKGLVSELDEWLAEPRNEAAERVLSEYFVISDFLRISEMYGGNYVTYIEAGEKTAFLIKLFCIDPSKMLSDETRKSTAAIFFSATLTPLVYFRNTLGGGENDYTLRLPSPFPQNNLCLMIDGRVSTKLRFRESSFEPVADRIYRVISARKGNYLAFFSSYAYMGEVAEIFQSAHPEINTLAQSPDMDEAARESFLQRFTPESEETMLAFAVLGGVFSEGVDLKAERLIGVIVVGVGLPMITEERNVISEYYSRLMDMGFEYAYVYPGMNKVMQAVGRVIRSESDRGVALLIDSRFAGSDYKCLFPSEWSHARYINGPKDMEETLEGFWAGR
ncbi:MAG: ATP-dependent DNA helicase [Clostridiales bacterium]|jgi:DNA excision repair protein ERCC-2|nr:ATP-dependent DNA helicase [Clostridiales bacterium]